MKQLDIKADLCLCDPPYGIGEDGKSNHSRGCMAETTKFVPKDWDNKPLSKEQFLQIQACSKNQIIFGGNYFVDFLHSTNCWIVWDKDNGATDFADCELAWTSFNTAVRKFKWRWQGMLQEKGGSQKEKRVHPTQKPVELMKWCLEKYSKTGDLILDPFAGSGTTAIACELLGRRWILIEQDEDYCEIAAKRIEKASKQFSLFERTQ
jgi:site-specific DNA-methyltransferase (adenine-specific)